MEERSGLVEQVRASLVADERVRPYVKSIDIGEEDGTIVLLGEVPRLPEKRRAETMAKSVLGVDKVKSAIRVIAVPWRNDEALRQAVFRAFAQDPYIDETAIAIEVVDGVVKLEGTVNSLVTKRLIGATAWWVPGVRDVVNSIEVHPPEEDNDWQIVEACRAVLEKDPFVDADELLVHADEGVVILTGAVCAPEERQMAESDVWFVEGVRDVLNELVVVPPRTPEERRDFAP